MGRLNDLEAEIRRRLQAAATGSVVYREAPTVGSDRDIMSFFLEWQTEDRRLVSIAVHIDHVNGRILCHPVTEQEGTSETSLLWLESLIAQISHSRS